MRILTWLAARLYPAWWRRRYGAEYDALLEEIRPGWRDLLSVLTGALMMQMRTVNVLAAVCGVIGALFGGG
jgi:hypothetical protein